MDVSMERFGDTGLDLEQAELEAQPTREVGAQAVWSLSSCKQGFGVDQLRDGSPLTYWQSDGPQPHLVNVQFHRKTRVCALRIFASIKQDESYTPSRVSVRAGTTFPDMREVAAMELNDPEGWVSIPLHDAEGHPLRTNMVQVSALCPGVWRSSPTDAEGSQHRCCANGGWPS